MTPLADFLDRHPLATGAAGASAGLLSWLAETLHIAAGIMADIGFIAGSLLSVLTLLYFIDGKARQHLRNRAQRRQHFDQDVDGHE